MKYRKLRVAWSLMWGVVAVLLFALWCRTYNWSDSFSHLTGTQQWRIMSEYGYVHVIVQLEIFTAQVDGWHHHVTPADPAIRQKVGVLFPIAGTWRGFHYGKHYTIYSAGAPYWAPFLLSSTFAVLPWIRGIHWRFSLRTLLIATTMIAVGLGAIIYATRS